MCHSHGRIRIRIKVYSRTVCHGMGGTHRGSIYQCPVRTAHRPVCEPSLKIIREGEGEHYCILLLDLHIIDIPAVTNITVPITTEPEPGLNRRCLIRTQ